MSRKITLILIFILIGFFGQGQLPQANPQNSMSEYEKKSLLFLVNKLRSKGCMCGNQKMQPVPALTWDDRLEAAAALHSEDMYEGNFISHFGSDGSKFNNRISKAGFVWSSCAENVADGYESVEEVMQGWYKSPAHCRNMMSPNYQFMGAARSGNYWTQDFGGR